MDIIMIATVFWNKISYQTTPGSKTREAKAIADPSSQKTDTFHSSTFKCDTIGVRRPRKLGKKLTDLT